MDEVRYYNSSMTLEEAEQYIQSGLITAARAYVANGYYLRRIRDDKLFEEAGYQNFEDYVRGKYNKDKGWASKCIKVNQQLSEEGNSPILSKQYLEYSTYQLVELAYMSEEQREEADPDMTVNQLKQIRKPDEVVELEKSCDVTTFEPEEKEQDPEKASDQEKRFNSIERGCITGLSPYGSCVCCGYDGAECCNQCEESRNCNGRCGWLEESHKPEGPKEQPKEQPKELAPSFSSTLTKCIHRTGYSCTVPIDHKEIAGTGNNCGSSCCWICIYQGRCELECNASAGRDGEIPKYDAAWATKFWAEQYPKRRNSVLRVCREQKNNSDRAKAVQMFLAPAGYSGQACDGNRFHFSSFTAGIDFHIGKVDFHLKYGRFVQELMNLYPDFEGPVNKEPETVIEEPENVPEQPESVPESPETVIDGEFVEIQSEPETSVRSILEEEKKELQDWIKACETDGVEVRTTYIKRQKIIVAALEAMAEEQERLESESEPEPAKQEQPELPILKNNDQRGAFIDAYETWPLWIETEKTGERYYRYDLSDGTSMVVKVYHAMLFDYKATGKKYEDRYSEGYGKHEYYFLKEGKFFRDCETNRSDLIEKLKELQKKGRGDK